MANRFQVDITALDKFTPTFELLNKQAQRTSDTMGKGYAVQRQWAAGFGRGLAGVSATAERTADSLGLMNAPLSAMFSVAGAGSIIGGIGAAVAGVGLLTMKFAGAASEIDRTSMLLGVNAQSLQAWRNAARLAGGSAEGMTSVFNAVGRTAQDSLYGRNPQAAMLMRHLGIEIARNKDGGVNVEGTWQNMAAAITRIKDPMTVRTVAGALGLPEDAITLAGAGERLSMARANGGIFTPAQIAAGRAAEMGKQLDLMRAAKLGDGIAASKANPLGNLLQRQAESAAADVRDSQRSDAEFKAEADALRGRFSRNLDPRGAAGAASAPQVNIEVKVPRGARVRASSNGPSLRVQRSGPEE